MRISITTALMISMLLIPWTAGRQIENWTYERLFEESNLVLIGSAEGTVETNDQAPDVRWKENLVGQHTTFSIIKTLKGQVTDGPVTVLHFKLKDGLQTQNGPLLVAFRTKGLKIEVMGADRYQVMLGRPQYLLFLKESDSGRFEPVSGQIDPVLSVREIYSPLPPVMDHR